MSDTQYRENVAALKLMDTRWSFEGFRVTLRDLPQAIASEEGEDDVHTCWMVMCLNGDLRVSVVGSEGESELCLSPGNCLLHYAPEVCTCGRCCRDQRAQLLEISCPADDLHRLIGDTPLGRDLRDAMAGRRPMHIHRPMTTAVHQALTGLRETIARGKVGSGPLIISKALEMVWHFTHCGGRDVSAQIAPETLRALDLARTILEENMETPPDLESLASQVGMSLSKFKQLFPQAHGMPPYALLRQARMERAMHLLRDKGRSVTETALEVGYSNLSHFSKTFAEFHGVKPSQARKSS